MEFRTIDPILDREMIIAFRKDSYVVSFGHSSGFGDEDDYVTRISERVLRFPEGQVIVEEDGAAIGQLELQIVRYEGSEIGYANLFYLIAEYRGKGRGSKLISYAEKFFRKQGVKEYQLRVSLDNQRAISLYERLGMHKLQVERLQNSVWRMRKEL